MRARRVQLQLFLRIKTQRKHITSVRAEVYEHQEHPSIVRRT